MPWKLTKTEIKLAVGGSKETFGAAFNALASEERISHNQTRRSEAGTTKSRLLWGLSPTRPDQDGPGWVKEPE